MSQTHKVKYMLIRLSRGLFAKVAACDYYRLIKWKWYAHAKSHGARQFYATRNASRAERKEGAPTLIFMHRCILDVPRGMQTDHINRDGLDNRLANLRVVTPSQNQFNSPARKGTSKYKGVSWHKRDRVWWATIRVSGNNRYLGSFHDEVEAAKAYDDAAFARAGVYAYLNFPERYAPKAAEQLL